MAPAQAQRIPLGDFAKHFGSQIELSSESLGGRILSFSDEFFSPAVDLLKPQPAVSRKGTFGPNGALFDGWETRRHNPAHDWVIIKLGPPSGTIYGLDIDTSHFNGNEGPAASVAACFLPNGQPNGPNDPAWQEILPISKLGPSSSHLFVISPELQKKPFTHVKLMMHPDGGIARFRVYGSVIPIFPPDLDTPLDLAHSFNGGRVVFVSDQHYGVGSNLLLSGRGKDMGDGWETKRSRTPGHKDWVVVKLGAPGFLDWAEIDTAHFLGNFPESVDLYATTSEAEVPPETASWQLLLPRTKMGPHRQHCLQLQRLGKPTTHVRMTIYPDGGIKRLRLMGRRAASLSSLPPADRMPQPSLTSAESSSASTSSSSAASFASKGTSRNPPAIPALPLTSEAFAPYGFVIQSYPNPHHVPRGIKINSANFGSATKYNRLSPITALAVPGKKNLKQTENFSVYRCQPTQSFGESDRFKVEVLERHEFTTQTFLPLGGGAERYLIIVALPAKDGKPDLGTLRAFTATSAQAFTYKPNVWHHPMIALDATTDFACITNETGEAKLDCEILEYGKTVALVESVSQLDSSRPSRPSKL